MPCPQRFKKYCPRGNGRSINRKNHFPMWLRPSHGHVPFVPRKCPVCTEIRSGCPGRFWDSPQVVSRKLPRHPDHQIIVLCSPHSLPKYLRGGLLRVVLAEDPWPLCYNTPPRLIYHKIAHESGNPLFLETTPIPQSTPIPQ